MYKQSNRLGLCFTSNGNAVNDKVAKHTEWHVGDSYLIYSLNCGVIWLHIQVTSCRSQKFMW